MVFDKIVEIIRGKLNTPGDIGITMDTTFKDLKADSLDMLEVVMAIELEFDVEISDEDLAAINNVGAAVEYIERVCS